MITNIKKQWRTDLPLEKHNGSPRIHAADYVSQVTEPGSASSQRASSLAAHALQMRTMVCFSR